MLRVFGSSAELPDVEDAPAIGISVLKEQGTLSESAMTKILRDNPKAMYGLS